MARILLSKPGTTVQFDREKISPRGHTGGLHVAIWKALRAAGHEVVCLMAARGTPPEGMRCVFPDVRGVTTDTTEADHVAAMQPTLDEIREFNPDVCLTIMGRTPTMSVPWNCKGIRIQDTAAKWSVPEMWITAMLGKPRGGIVDDRRAYPREQELTLMWPQCIPAAMLGMRDNEYERVIGGVRTWNYERYAKLETLIDFPIQHEIKIRDVCLVAHAHVTTGFQCKQVRLAALMNAIGNDVIELHKEHGLVIAGEGWGDVPLGYDEPLLGCVNPSEADRVMAESRFAILLASAPEGWLSNKITRCVRLGTIPLLYGRGEPCTFDHEQRYVPFDSQLRFSGSSELLLKLNGLRSSTMHCLEAERLRILEATAPDPSIVLEAVDSLARGERLVYGGMRAPGARAWR